MKLKSYRKLFLIAALVPALMLGCAKNEEPEVVVEEPEPQKEIQVEIIEEEEPEIEEGPRSALTNELCDETVAIARPLAVMIENTKVALPHYGLCDAGVIYEVPAEGGITRYLAVYDKYDEFERLGNVRSARPYFVYLAGEYGALYAHYGESVGARGLLNTGVVDEINGMTDSVTYYRTSDKKAPHNAYISSEGLYQSLERYGFDTTLDEDFQGFFNFSQEPNLLPQGEDAGYVSLYYFNNKPYFIYDPESQTYTRYAYGALEPDGLSEDGIHVTNIILQNVDSRVEDSEGHLSITLTGQGQGKYITMGKAVDIFWEKESSSDRTHYYMIDGTEIELNEGRTYIGLIENSQKNSNVIKASIDS